MSDRTKGQIENGQHPAVPNLWILRPIMFGEMVRKLPECEGGSAGFRCKGDADFIEASWNAAHRLGLTAEQLDAGVLEKLVEAARLVYDGLDMRIERADPRSVPVFAGIADLHDALTAFPKKKGDGFEAGTLPDNIPAWNEPTQRQLYGKECE